ncbi:MarR family transcriptional regulator [Paenibacillus sp. IB182493]|uniref:MarR family transcriptional regulator n=2 Tax=Paenibacillus arenilitoris TaxID=2772299 RepID=A0A927H8U0_9BACL|nr:MarR family transcriptional regulator [Paenibacillus arenilitoris]
MEQLLELFLHNGLRPLGNLSETNELERKVNRSELTALVLLYYRGQLTMSALASGLGVPLSTTTSLVQRLVRKGLAERTQSTLDQRIMNVELTADGRELALQAKSIMENMLARVQAALSQEELEQFLVLAVKVGKALQQGNDQQASGRKDGKLRKIAIDD